jgi:hypothetical protein
MTVSIETLAFRTDVWISTKALNELRCYDVLLFLHSFIPFPIWRQVLQMQYTECLFEISKCISIMKSFMICTLRQVLVE